jgi:UDP-glucose 4-epimerase
VRIAITGASGFLGSAVLPWLARRGDASLLGLTRTLPVDAEPSEANVTWLEGDLASAHDCAALVADADVVIHLAHTHTPLTSNRDLPSDAAANLVPMLTLVQAIRERRSRPHVVFASSGGALYAAPPDRAPVPETAPCLPTTSYGIQKLAEEHYLRLAAHERWLTATVLRIGNPYGVPLPPTRMQGFIGVAVSRLRDGLPVKIFGDPDNVRDYVHLTDVCRMFEAACESRGEFGVFNVGSGRGASVREIVSQLESISDRGLIVEHEPPTEDAARLPHWIVLDCTKAARDYAWVPQIELEQGLRLLWEQASAS